MRAELLGIGLLLVGCVVGAPLPETTPYRYEARGLLFLSAIPLNVAALEANLSELEPRLIDTTGDAQALASAQGLEIYVHKTSLFEDQGEYLAGSTAMVGPRLIVLGSTGVSLLHEMFHEWQLRQNLMEETMAHVSWDAPGGFDESSRSYIAVAQSIDGR